MFFFPWTIKFQYYTYRNILRFVQWISCFTSGKYCVFQSIKCNICARVFYKVYR